MDLFLSLLILVCVIASNIANHALYKRKIAKLEDEQRELNRRLLEIELNSKSPGRKKAHNDI